MHQYNQSRFDIKALKEKDIFSLEANTKVYIVSKALPYGLHAVAAAGGTIYCSFREYNTVYKRTKQIINHG